MELNWIDINTGLPTDPNGTYLVTDGHEIATTQVYGTTRFADGQRDFTFGGWSGDENTNEQNECCSGEVVFELTPTHWCPVSEITLPNTQDNAPSALSEYKETIIANMFKSACGYAMAEGNGTQSKFAEDGSYMPNKTGGTVEGGRKAFHKCMESIPDEYFRDFVYTLYRIADKAGSDGFDLPYE